MAQEPNFASPNRPRRNIPFTDLTNGWLTLAGVTTLDQMWRQVASGFVIVPCDIAGTNQLTLTAQLNQFGDDTLADHMTFAGVPPNTSTGTVTLFMGDIATEYKVYKSAGVQAGAGDVVAAWPTLFIYNSAFDSGNGGFALR